MKCKHCLCCAAQLLQWSFSISCQTFVTPQHSFPCAKAALKKVKFGTGEHGLQCSFTFIPAFGDIYRIDCLIVQTNSTVVESPNVTLLWQSNYNLSYYDSGAPLKWNVNCVYVAQHNFGNVCFSISCRTFASPQFSMCKSSLEKR